jgi:hypothetical protein
MAPVRDRSGAGFQPSGFLFSAVPVLFPADRFDQAKAAGAEQKIKHRWSASV